MIQIFKENINKPLRIFYSGGFLNIQKLINMSEDEYYLYFYDDKGNKYAILKSKYVGVFEPKSENYRFGNG